MIRDDDVAALLRAATDDIDVPVIPAEALVRAGHQSLHRRRIVAAVTAIAAVAAVAVGIPLAIRSQQSAPPPASAPSTTGPPLAGCRETVPDAVLPGWARGGFSDPPPRIGYVLGDKGDIIAILFAQPLTSPPAAHYNNKILWVSRPQEPVGTPPQSFQLRIDARLTNGSATVIRRLPDGPGPSIINLPKPGCWHLTLHWSGHTDSLNLAYVPR